MRIVASYFVTSDALSNGDSDEHWASLSPRSIIARADELIE
jgi:hypothetical protein